MKTNEDSKLDLALYGLIYPGFLGSMLYEMLPTGGATPSWSYFFPTTGELLIYVQYSIILFYLFDYVHLCGDMNSIIGTARKKDWIYYFCDMMTCLLYVVSFIQLKYQQFEYTIFAFWIVPLLFLWYKRHNAFDRRFYALFFSIATFVPVYRVSRNAFASLPHVDDQVLALCQISICTALYASYIFFLYQRKAKGIDEAWYGTAETQNRAE